MDVAQWLHDLGLPGYAALFREQAIDAAHKAGRTAELSGQLGQ
jgi:SAM (Sterile alpha motif) domain-containing protein